MKSVLNHGLGVCLYIGIVFMLRVGNLEDYINDSAYEVFNSKVAYPHTLSTAISDSTCLQSFHNFAYKGPLPTNKIEGIVLPHYPWQYIATAPPHQTAGYYEEVFQLDVEMIHERSEHQEIWLRGAILGLEMPTKIVFAIYQTASQTWEYIDSNIEGTDLFAQELFSTRDGSVWGAVKWGYDKGLTVPTQSVAHPNSISVLSRFNENNRRFELVEGIIEIPLDMSDFNWTNILLDQHDVFWIFVKNHGLYRYTPATQITEKLIDLEISIVGEATLAPDNSIYFKEMEWYVMGNTIFQFIPETQDVVRLATPGEKWPIPYGMIVDSTNKLWLGSSGYREVDGSWHLINPYPEEFFEHLGEYLWSPPLLMLESSDGRLWYRRYLDTSGWAEGTAWYDPKTDEGCMFTNWAGNIMEDTHHQLWMVADEKLYKYELNSK